MSSSFSSAWSSEIPADLLRRISESLTTLADHIRFAAVCRWWSSAAAETTPIRTLPYLVIPDPNHHHQEGAGVKDSRAPRCFYSFHEKKIYRPKLPEASRDWHCLGSSHGWLAMVDLDAGIGLFNPLTGACVELPPMTTFPGLIDVVDDPEKERPGIPLYVFFWRDGKPVGLDGKDFRDFYMRKVVLSSPDPISDPNCIVMVIYDDRCLGYTRPGDANWTTLLELGFPYEDVVYVGDGRFYALAYKGNVIAIDFDLAGRGRGPPRTETFAPAKEPLHYEGKKYLVTLPSGELLQVLRHNIPWEGEKDPYQTQFFDVLKLVVREDGKKEWLEVKDLGDHALFLGLNHSMSLSSSEVSGGCKANSIYFTDDWEGHYDDDVWYGGHDFGIYHLEEKTIDDIYTVDSKTVMPPPIWITPRK